MRHEAQREYYHQDDKSRASEELREAVRGEKIG